MSSFKIMKTKNGRTTVIKDAIARQVMTWENQADAEAFARSMFANARCDWKNQGRQLPQYTVVPA